MSITDLAAQIQAGQQASGATLRTGVVSALAGATLTVDVGGGQLVAMPYLGGYTPIIGDHVQILQQAAVNLVIGAPAGIPADNAVNNASFEVDPPLSTTITSWAKLVTSGTPTVRVSTADTWTAVDGSQMAEIYQTVAGSTADVSLISDPITVAEGEAWTAAASWLGYADGVSTPMVSPIAQLSLAWMRNATAAYPDVVAETVIMQAPGPFGAMREWSTLRVQAGTGTPVPPGAYALRIRLNAVLDSTGGIWFDRILARKVN